MSGIKDCECRSHPVIPLIARDFVFPVPVILGCVGLELLVTKGRPILVKEHGEDLNKL